MMINDGAPSRTKTDNEYTLDTAYEVGPRVQILHAADVLVSAG